MQKYLPVMIAWTAVLYGAFPPTGPSTTLSEVQNASQSVEGEASQKIGAALHGNADFNGDGTPDVASLSAGKFAFVVFGSTDRLVRTSLLSGTNGFAMPTSIMYYKPLDLKQCDEESIRCVLTFGGDYVSNQGTTVRQICTVLGTNVMPSMTNEFYLNGTNGWRLIGTTNARYIAYCSVGCENFTGTNSFAVANRAVVEHPADDRCIYITYCVPSMPAVFTVDDLNGTNGMAIVGGTYLSEFVASGDINGDGLGDIICTDESGWGGTNGYIIFGKRRYCKELNLNTLTTNDGVVLSWSYGVAIPIDTADMNADGIDDIIFKGGVMLGRTNWPANLYNGGIGFPTMLGIIGDINGDGYVDAAENVFTGEWPNPYIYYVTVGYGRPVIPSVGYADEHFFNGTNGFTIKDDGALQAACRGGDWDKDGYEEAIFAWPFADPGGRTDAGEIYITHGGPSPAWSPYIFSPTLLLEGQSNVYYSDQLTNIVIGRKGKRHCVLTDAGQPVAQDWLGTWWTNMMVRSATTDTVTVRYWSTNVISVSNPATTLVLTAIPEPCLLLVAMVVLCSLGTLNGERE
jgi:hypothetical protein